MTQQTINCGYFISSYTEDKNFCLLVCCVPPIDFLTLQLFYLPGIRVAKNLFLGVDAAIKTSIIDSKSEFQTHATVQARITILRIQDNFESLGKLLCI